MTKQLRDLCMTIRTDGSEHVTGAYTEHVNVLVGSRCTDMFTKNLPRNNWLTQHPESMACIVGPAVVFSDRVWY